MRDDTRPNTLTHSEKEALRGVILAVAEAIRELKTIPSGELYAHLMGKLSLDSYSAVISVLQALRWIKVENHLITWIGPEGPVL